MSLKLWKRKSYKLPRSCCKVIALLEAGMLQKTINTKIESDSNSVHFDRVTRENKDRWYKKENPFATRFPI